MSDFNAHIGLGIEQSLTANGRKLLDLVGMCTCRESIIAV